MPAGKADPVGEIIDTPFGTRLVTIPEDVREVRTSRPVRLVAMPNGGVKWEPVDE